MMDANILCIKRAIVIGMNKCKWFIVWSGHYLVCVMLEVPVPGPILVIIWDAILCLVAVLGYDNIQSPHM